MNQCAFKHSVRNLPLNDSMKALSVGLPGREKSSVTPRWYAHRSKSRDTLTGLAVRRRERPDPPRVENDGPGLATTHPVRAPRPVIQGVQCGTGRARTALSRADAFVRKLFLSWTRCPKARRSPHGGVLLSDRRLTSQRAALICRHEADVSPEHFQDFRTCRRRLRARRAARAPASRRRNRSPDSD